MERPQALSSQPAAQRATVTPLTRSGGLARGAAEGFGSPFTTAGPFGGLESAARGLPLGDSRGSSLNGREHGGASAEAGVLGEMTNTPLGQGETGRRRHPHDAEALKVRKALLHSHTVSL